MDNKDKADQTQNAGAARQGGITSIEGLTLYGWDADGMEVDNAFGHYYKKVDVERLISAGSTAASLARQSQAAQPPSQAAFEAWALVNGFKVERRNDADSPDTYFRHETEQRWIVWQAAHIAGTSQAAKAQADGEITAKLNAAVDAEYPLPDTPHTSVKMQWVDNRAAMWRGINAARKILAPVVTEAQAVSEGDSDMFDAFYPPRAKLTREEWDPATGKPRIAAPVAKEAPAVLEGWTVAKIDSAFQPNALRVMAPNGSAVTLRGDAPEPFEVVLFRYFAQLVASVAKEATLDNVAPGIPPASQVQADEAKLYRDLTGDAMALGFDGVPAALEAVRKVKTETGSVQAKPIAAAVRAAERVDAMHKGVVGVFAAIKAEHHAQANVLPPFAAPAGQHEAIVGAVARGLGAPDCRYDELDKKVVDAIVREVEDALASGFREGRNAQTKSAESSDVATTTSTVSAPEDWTVFAKLPDIHAKLREAYRKGAAEQGADAQEYAAVEAIMRAWDLLDAAPSSTEGAQKAPEEVRNAILEEAAEKLDAMNDSSGDAAAYDQREQNVYELEREHAISDCAKAIRALKTGGE